LDEAAYHLRDRQVQGMCAKCGEVARLRATSPVAPAAHIDEVMAADVEL